MACSSAYLDILIFLGYWYFQRYANLSGNVFFGIITVHILGKNNFGEKPSLECLYFNKYLLLKKSKSWSSLLDLVELLCFHNSIDKLPNRRQWPGIIIVETCQNAGSIGLQAMLLNNNPIHLATNWSLDRYIFKQVLSLRKRSQNKDKVQDENPESKIIVAVVLNRFQRVRDLNGQLNSTSKQFFAHWYQSLWSPQARKMYNFGTHNLHWCLWGLRSSFSHLVLSLLYFKILFPLHLGLISFQERRSTLVFPVPQRLVSFSLLFHLPQNKVLKPQFYTHQIVALLRLDFQYSSFWRVIFAVGLTVADSGITRREM